MNFLRLCNKYTFPIILFVVQGLETGTGNVARKVGENMAMWMRNVVTGCWNGGGGLK